MLSMPKRRSSCARRLSFSSMHAALRKRPLDRHQQLVVDQRLGEVVERAGANGFDRAVRRAVAGDQDDLRWPASCGGIARADRSRRRRAGGCRPAPGRTILAAAVRAPRRSRDAVSSSIPWPRSQSAIDSSTWRSSSTSSSCDLVMACIGIRSSAISHLPLTAWLHDATRGGGERSFDNLGAVVSPNIYVTGSGGSTKRVIGEHEGPVVTVMRFVAGSAGPYNSR